MIDSKYDILIAICIIIMAMGIVYGIVHGSSNSTSFKNMTLDCLRMFYSDSWNKGYVESLAKFCSK